MILILIILAIITNIFNFKLRKRRNLHVYDYLLFHLLYVIFFFYFFLFLFRFSNLIKGVMFLDLKLVFDKIDLNMSTIILFIIFIWIILNIRNIILFYTKITLLKIHYFFLFFSLKKGYKYQNFVYSVCFLERNMLFFLLRFSKNILLAKRLIKLLRFMIKYIFLITIIILFFVELYFNNLILNYSMVLLPFFGLYQITISVFLFICNKMYYVYDVELAMSIYLYELLDDSNHRADYIKALPEHIKVYIDKILLK